MMFSVIPKKVFALLALGWCSQSVRAKHQQSGDLRL